MLSTFCTSAVQGGACIDTDSPCCMVLTLCLQPTVASDATGYHAKRREFEPEYDHEAEVMLADMDFGEDEDPADVQQKLAMMHIYNK